MTDENGQTSPTVTWRQVLGTGGAVTGALLMTGLPLVANAAGTVPASDAAGAPEPGALVHVTLTINGYPHRLQLDPRMHCWTRCAGTLP
jgi:hypothetical protein